MKPIYYITFTGYYELKNGKLSSRKSTFSLKDTNTDFSVGDTVIHKGRFFHIIDIEYEKI